MELERGEPVETDSGIRVLRLRTDSIQLTGGRPDDLDKVAVPRDEIAEIARLAGFAVSDGGMEAVTDEQIDAIYDRIRDSVELAMKGEDVDEETREAVLATVDDAVGNQF